MESKFQAQLEKLMKQDSVTGVVCGDSSGLPLAACGIATHRHAGLVSAIANQASKIFPSLNEVPIICIEGEKTNLLIRSEDKMVLGIFKTKV
ncbi:ragulator complex protein LAMTOR5 isoform X1 [Hydra vulgaris]|uniref:Late endosomal/lysosomal adaptor and MAPK and MTOR activator 5 n=1 Tax=Hydra vulgaris TaxID=6087 RepID=T2MIN4_HYDVU|nr:ragulator complex protein LAMTOR5 [Hydra vulgaris]